MLVATLVALVWLPSVTRAAPSCSITWVGDVDGAWYGGALGSTNWSNDEFPNSEDHVCLLNDQGGPYAVTLDTSVEVGSYGFESDATLIFGGEPAGEPFFIARHDSTNAGTIRLVGAVFFLAEDPSDTDMTTKTLTNTGTIVTGGPDEAQVWSGDIVNQGTISVVQQRVRFRANFEARAPKLTNAATGTLTVAADGELSTANAQPFANAGTVAVTGTLITKGYVQTAGTSSVVGGASAEISVGSGQTLELQGGTLNGNGTVGPDVNNTGGTLAPGASPGTLLVESDYAQGAGGTLTVEVSGPNAGTGFDQLRVGDFASLGGTLSVATSGFTPALGQRFKIIDAPAPPAGPTVTGTFATVQESGQQYDVIHSPTDVVLEAATVGGLRRRPLGHVDRQPRPGDGGADAHLHPDGREPRPRRCHRRDGQRHPAF